MNEQRLKQNNPEINLQRKYNNLKSYTKKLEEQLSLESSKRASLSAEAASYKFKLLEVFDTAFSQLQQSFQKSLVIQARRFKQKLEIWDSNGSNTQESLSIAMEKRLLSEKNELIREISELKNLIKENESQKKVYVQKEQEFVKRIDVFQQDNEIHIEQIKGLNKELRELNEKYLHLQSEIRDVQDRSSLTYQSKINQLTREKENHAETVKLLEKQLQVLQNSNRIESELSEKSKDENEDKNNQANLSKLQHDFEQLNVQSNLIKIEHENLQAQFDTERRYSNTLTEKLEEKDNALTTYKNKIELLQNVLETENTRHDALEAQFKVLSSENQLLKNKIDELKEKEVEFKQSLEALESKDKSDNVTNVLNQSDQLLETKVPEEQPEASQEEQPETTLEEQPETTQLEPSAVTEVIEKIHETSMSVQQSEAKPEANSDTYRSMGESNVNKSSENPKKRIKIPSIRLSSQKGKVEVPPAPSPKIPGQNIEIEPQINTQEFENIEEKTEELAKTFGQLSIKMPSNIQAPENENKTLYNEVYLNQSLEKSEPKTPGISIAKTVDSDSDTPENELETTVPSRDDLRQYIMSFLGVDVKQPSDTNEIDTSNLANQPTPEELEFFQEELEKLNIKLKKSIEDE